tara:strand:+ start:2356 stop:2799 length:444 start_codon:yes stop_codon:yes gene_type:complete
MKEINIHSNPEYDTPNEKICKSIINYVFSKEKINLYEISVIFTSDIYVSDLKKRFFLKDQWTDVIAFPLHSNKKEKIEGEIYISMPTAKENADKFNQAYEKEVARLIIHGVLHLLDYSDQSYKGKQIMSKMEENILKETRWKTLFET